MRITSSLNFLTQDLITIIKSSELTKVIIQNKKIIAIVAAVLSAIGIVSYTAYYFWRKVQQKPTEGSLKLSEQISGEAPKSKDPLTSATSIGKVLRGTIPGTLPNIEGFKCILSNKVWDDNEKKHIVK